MPTHSTGALTPEEHAEQDRIYSQGHKYDYLFIGTGIAALTTAALLAKSGKKVCMLEAHDVPGGYAHSFKMGDFYFCAQIHYIWGCGKGDTIDAFLKKLGLEKELTFEIYDPEGYDLMVMPDGKKIKIPCGFDKLADNIEAAYPGQKTAVTHFTSILQKIRNEMRKLPSNLHFGWWKILSNFWKYWTLIKYRNKTLQDVFDECKLSKEARAVLGAQAGDFMSPPEELSIMAYVGLFCGYNSGAYYPTKHYKGYIDRIAKFITDAEGCHIYYETPVNKIRLGNGLVMDVKTENGKTFTANTFICNADPQSTSNMIGREKFPKKYLPALSYSYSPAGMVIYLGLKNIDLKKHGFGKFNIWHCTQWDMNKCWKEQLEGNFDQPWVFISTATLHTQKGGVTPAGMEIMEIATLTDYESFRKLKVSNPKAYRQKKMDLAEKLLDIVEKHYIPDFRDHIAVKVIGSPSTNFDYVRAPFGTAYGSLMTPEQIGMKRLKADSPWPNFFWCNASSGFAGFYGTTSTGVSLYMQLTGDNFFDASKTLSDEEYIKAVWNLRKKNLTMNQSTT